MIEIVYALMYAEANQHDFLMRFRFSSNQVGLILVTTKFSCMKYDTVILADTFDEYEFIQGRNITWEYRCGAQLLT